MAYLQNTWYVAAWSHEVGAELFHRRILGEPVLIYRKSDGGAVAIGDVCPHRFAPLYLGRVRGDAVECGYHGLQFDGSGTCVHNPHGGKISAACRVRAYPLVERYGILWIWAGAVEAADPALIPDFGYLVEKNQKTVYGFMHLRANYELINDNLMDASHTQYVHADLLGTDAFMGSKHEVIQEGAAVHSKYSIPHSRVPESYRGYFEGEEPVVDLTIHFRWLPASLVRNNVSLIPVGRPAEEGIHRTGTHLMTPETETTTHYFFAHTRNFRLDDASMDERVRKWQEAGLTHQDGPMIEAVQEVMGAVTDIDSLHPVYLPIDTAAVRVRRTLARLIEAETRGESETVPARSAAG